MEASCAAESTVNVTALEVTPSRLAVIVAAPTAWAVASPDAPVVTAFVLLDFQLTCEVRFWVEPSL